MIAEYIFDLPCPLHQSKFDLQSISGAVETAVLRLYAQTTNNFGHEVHETSNDWLEGR